MSKTARELLDSLHANCPVAGCPSCELNARVEKVLALHVEAQGGVCRDCDYLWPCPTVRVLDGLEEP